MPSNQDSNKDIATFLSNRMGQEPEDQILEARQILAEMNAIDSVAAFPRVQRKIKQKSKSIKLINVLTRVAALLFIPLLAATFWTFYRTGAGPVQKYAMQQITSPPGIRSQVVLPDGSKVWLNSESTIQFPVPFHKESRNIALQGEAFFDVAKNPDQPFIVESGKVKVKVLGTRFNVKAYGNEANTEVILEEGKIALTLPENNKQEIPLKPGDRLVYEKTSNKASLSNENIQKYIAWHTGKLVFNDTPITEVAQMLSRWYGIEVIVTDPEIMNYRFTTTFENESLFQVIELLSMSSPIQIKYVPATVGRDHQTQTKSKVIINKKIKT
jgi:ferric-dicitrate binding protein FerR (iron transport regulator)